MRTRYLLRAPLLTALLVLWPLGSPGAVAHDTSPSPPAKVPAGVILVKGAWSSSSDSATPWPEGGRVTRDEYQSTYFQLSYPLSPGWVQQFEGPPPSDSGYYVLAQLQPPNTVTTAGRGSVLISAQDMFFAAIPAASALELVTFSGNHLRADYRLERPPAEVNLAGHSFARLDYTSPAAMLHWSVLATQLRCHIVQFTLASPDPQVIERLVSGLNNLKLSSVGAPVCIKDYATTDTVLNRVDPIFTDRRFNPIPVRVIIDGTGQIQHIHFVSAFPEQARMITEALQQWRFKPHVVNGKAVEVETGILFGTATNRALISGRHDPQLVPARKHDPT